MGFLRLDEILKEKSITGKELAVKLGVTENAISLIKKDKRQPRFELLSDIAKHLDVDIKDLFVSTKDNDLNGFIEFDGVIHRINSKKDLEGLISIIEQK